MAIEDFYKDLEVLQNNEIENDIDKKDSWETAFTCQGIVNMNSGHEMVYGKIISQNVGKAFCEITDITKTITSNNRLKQGGKIYKIIGEPINTMDLDHHLKMTVEYIDISQE